MSLSIIVAMTEDRVIGKDNTLPWHLSDDLKRFKKITMGHPIIMGRKTFDSIGKPLPGRQNVVVTRDRSFSAAGILIAFSLEEALLRCDKSTGEEFLIGGAQLYKAALPFATKIYLTLIRKKFDGNIYFPDFDLTTDLVSSQREDAMCNGIPVTYVEGILKENAGAI